MNRLPKKTLLDQVESKLREKSDLSIEQAQENAAKRTFTNHSLNQIEETFHGNLNHIKTLLPQSLTWKDEWEIASLEEMFDKLVKRLRTIEKP